MPGILRIPEIAAFDSRCELIRIPPDLDVPLTPRIRRLIDTVAFRRLSQISQLGLVSLVYPAAHHTRFEHSLGVYRLAILLLKRLAYEERFARLAAPEDAELLIVSALLHDIGHWPFCHPIEDVKIPGIKTHESCAASFLLEGEIANLLRSDWSIEPQRVLDVLNKTPQKGTCSSEQMSRILISILSGPIDIDKMDYLFRDSLHAGVPYGKHFDQNRLIGSLCLNEAENGLALTDKGKTAAELMVFARYVMFNEVYWHKSVRSATSMIQRIFFTLQDRIDLPKCFRSTEQEMIQHLFSLVQGTEVQLLWEGLFGTTRKLYKRVAQFSILEQEKMYRQIAGRPYSWLCETSEKLNRLLQESGVFPLDASTCSILIDAPPVEKEVEFRIDVFYPKEELYRPLESVSPVVRVLAQEQFDHYVKRVRFYAAPQFTMSLQNIAPLLDALEKISIPSEG